MTPIIYTNNTSNLKDAFNSFIATIEGSGNLLSALSFIGIGMIIIGTVMFFWKKNRGQGANTLLWVIGAGAVLAAPKIILPVVLTIIDFCINIIAYLITTVISGV